MSLPLCQFPLLIHVEIFKHLELESIFMLSLCSENTKRLIQRIRLKSKKLRYTVEDDQVSVLGGFTDDERDLKLIATMKCVTSISRKKTISVKLGGEPIKCRFERSSHTLKHLEPENKNVIELLKNHIDSLFHSKPIIQLKLHSPDSLSTSNSRPPASSVVLLPPQSSSCLLSRPPASSVVLLPPQSSSCLLSRPPASSASGPIPSPLILIFFLPSLTL
ncbi:hypothetical protein CRE_14090 [Caenorhabditis remanei]|uniref:F-box domain-containing protein n=1 Tax=Caenorhabditis remanei TaxID=31234 RepID=E3MRG7_CAERE|nr:hypothetical protein CRE_14090 [Caenorhabditis remanei]